MLLSQLGETTRHGPRLELLPRMCCTTNLSDTQHSLTKRSKETRMHCMMSLDAKEISTETKTYCMMNKDVLHHESGYSGNKY